MSLQNKHEIVKIISLTLSLDGDSQSSGIDSIESELLWESLLKIAPSENMLD